LGKAKEQAIRFALIIEPIDEPDWIRWSKSLLPQTNDERTPCRPASLI